MASISVTLDSNSSNPWVPESPTFDNEQDFYDYLNASNEIRDRDRPPVSEICMKQIFEDSHDGIDFPPFQNTRPIVSAHSKIWRAGHSNNILTLLTGTPEDVKSYFIGLLVSSITVLIVFLTWMILLITLKGLGSDRAGFLAGKRSKLPPKPVGEGLPSTEPQPVADLKPEEEIGTVEAAPESAEEDGNNGNGESSSNVDIKNEDGNMIDSDHLTSSSKRDSRETKRNVLLSKNEWNEVYSTKKKEERWMKIVVVFACLMVIFMSIVMAAKGVQSLKGSLDDGKASISYAEKLLDNAQGVVNELTNGLGEFQTDFLDLLERSNTGMCPRLKPEGLCESLLEVDSCDFTIEVDIDQDIVIDKLDVNTTVDFNYSHSVDVSKLSESIKDKIGIDGTLDLREILFPSAQNVYEDLVGAFSKDWLFLDKMRDFSDTIGSVSTLATETEEQINAINWVFYIAVIFDVIVGLLAVCMIIHILAGDRLPLSLKCFQRRCLFPFFIACVSIAFIFAIAFLIASMALSDSCANGPSDRILSVAQYYMGDRLAADYVTDIIKEWFSQCDVQPPSMQHDQSVTCGSS
ncbi:unnamed protein product [Pseudo-nitzschia multistriata]|uniref:Uncharacterized protein n=1 Tax=Pseudo-nitzschia multistriata TaxID=183589 RepID=A0A448ZCF2_9STRA|nr:unnamed protein product [Pseudo-nitzschia multistriata]